MTVNLEQVDGTIRTYRKALSQNSLTDKEKQECLKKIKEYEELRKKILKK